MCNLRPEVELGEMARGSVPGKKKVLLGDLQERVRGL